MYLKYVHYLYFFKSLKDETPLVFSILAVLVIREIVLVLGDHPVESVEAHVVVVAPRTVRSARGKPRGHQCRRLLRQPEVSSLRRE